MDADREIRYQRAFARKSETDRISFEKFQEEEAREMSSDNPNNQNLAGCIQKADYTINNNSDINQLRYEIEHFMQKINV